MTAPATHRIEVATRPGQRDPVGESVRDRLHEDLGIHVDEVRLVDVYTIHADLDVEQLERVRNELLPAPIIQESATHAPMAGPGPYLVENLHIDSRCMATNNMFTTAFRGFGATQACIAYEQQMDEAAKVLGIDRLELRRRNFLKTGHPIPTGFAVKSAGWTERFMAPAWGARGAPAGAAPSAEGRG